MITDDQLLTLNRASVVARLLAGMAHEVNNSLLVIGGTAELLEDGTSSAEAVTSGLARIRSQTGRAAAGIADVLAFARGVPSARSRVNLAELTGASVALRAYAIGRARLKVEFTPPEEGVAVQGSRVLLQQAILNLIANAEQALAGAQGGVIRIDLTRSDGMASLLVADTGPGVPADRRDRIFEVFESTGDPESSPGLGLPAARKIAEQHGGRLVLEEVSAGAAFLMELPLT
jgi:signal transduction histidine kinase